MNLDSQENIFKIKSYIPNETTNETKEDKEAVDPRLSRPTLPVHTEQAFFAIIYLFLFSFAMFTLPFIAFYYTKITLDNKYSFDNFQNTVWAVVAAVITANVIIFTYAFIGYYETEYDDFGNVVDQSKPKKH